MHLFADNEYALSISLSFLKQAIKMIGKSYQPKDGVVEGMQATLQSAPFVCLFSIGL